MLDIHNSKAMADHVAPHPHNGIAKQRDIILKVQDAYAEYRSLAEAKTGYKQLRHNRRELTAQQREVSRNFVTSARRLWMLLEDPHLRNHCVRHQLIPPLDAAVRDMIFETHPNPITVHVAAYRADLPETIEHLHTIVRETGDSHS